MPSRFFAPAPSHNNLRHHSSVRCISPSPLVDFDLEKKHAGPFPEFTRTKLVRSALSVPLLPSPASCLTPRAAVVLIQAPHLPYPSSFRSSSYINVVCPWDVPPPVERAFLFTDDHFEPNTSIDEQLEAQALLATSSSSVEIPPHHFDLDLNEFFPPFSARLDSVVPQLASPSPSYLSVSSDSDSIPDISTSGYTPGFSTSLSSFSGEIDAFGHPVYWPDVPVGPGEENYRALVLVARLLFAQGLGEKGRKNMSGVNCDRRMCFTRGKVESWRLFVPPGSTNAVVKLARDRLSNPLLPSSSSPPNRLNLAPAHIASGLFSGTSPS